MSPPCRRAFFLPVESDLDMITNVYALIHPPSRTANKLIHTLTGLLVIVLVFTSACSKADPPAAAAPPAPSVAKPSSAAGHWEGAISLPGTKLAIRVDLEQPPAGWQGTIDIPVQGLRGFKLGEFVVSDTKVAFKMPGIPGDPAFDGALSTDGQAMEGSFSQAGQTYSFQLARTEKVPEKNATPAKGIPGEGFAGVWQGSLKVQLFELRLVMKLKGSDDDLSGTMDSLDQNATGMPISRASAGGRRLQLEMKSIGGTFDGQLSEDGSEIAGEWQQGGQKTPLIFKRLEQAPDLSRPQDPKKPYPYESEELVFDNRDAGIKLAGTFTRPRSAGPHPAVVLLTGSGGQDRDEAIAGHRPFLVVADHLTRNGIAVLRFDDRGVGKSEGDFGKAVNEDFVSDALAAVAYLKTRPEVVPTKIGLIGHSEGGITAPRAAVKSGDVSFIVLLAGVGVPMEELLARQGRDLLMVMGGTSEMADGQAAVQREIFSIVKELGGSPAAAEKVRTALKRAVQQFTPEQLQAMGWSEAQMEGQVKMVLTPWFRELLTIDPRPTLAQVKCPVLAINGSKDIQVAAKENLEAIETAVKQGGNSNVRTIEFPGLNHLFQTCTTGAIAEYSQIEETFNPRALAAVSDWIRGQAGLR